MPVWFRILIIAFILIGTSSFLWLLLNTTAYFQRGMDILGTTYLVLVGIPILLLSLLLTVLLFKGWAPVVKSGYIVYVLAIVIIIAISAVIVHVVDSYGWTVERIRSDTLKVTEDGRYEYNIELVNLFQRSSYARLYLKDIDTGEEMYIRTDLQTREIHGITISHGEDYHWVRLESTDEDYRYILSTTERLRIPPEKLEINIRDGTSTRVE